MNWYNCIAVHPRTVYELAHMFRISRKSARVLRTARHML